MNLTLERRLAALEIRPGNRAYQRVVILGPDDPSPPDSDNIHIIRIVAAEPNPAAAFDRRATA